MRLEDVTPFAVCMRLMILFFIYCDCVYFALGSYSLRKILGCSLLTYMKFWLACFVFSLVTGGRPYLYDSERTLRINSPRQWFSVFFVDFLRVF
jgi:hypothetical protein